MINEDGPVGNEGHFVIWSQVRGAQQECGVLLVVQQEHLDLFAIVGPEDQVLDLDDILESGGLYNVPHILIETQPCLTVILVLVCAV